MIMNYPSAVAFITLAQNEDGDRPYMHLRVVLVIHLRAVKFRE